MNQKGFAPVVIILVVVFLCVGIAGGSYLVSKTFPNLISSADQTVSSQKPTSTQIPATSSSELKALTPEASVKPIQSGKNRLLSTINGTNFLISDLDGGNSKKLEDYLGSEYKIFQLLMSSPENKILVFLASKVDARETSFDAKTAFQNEGITYFLFDSSSEKAGKVNKSAFVDKFGQDIVYLPIGWSADGKGMIFSVILGDVKAPYPDNTVVLYDLDKKDVTTLTKFQGSTQRAFLDQNSYMLALNVSTEAGNKIRTVDLANQVIKDYARASVINSSGLGNEFGPFYVKGTKYEDILLKELMIYPTFSPNPNVQLKLSDKNLAYDNTVIWSPNYSVVQIKVMNKENRKGIESFSSYLFSFYTPEGKLISRFDSTKSYPIQNKETKLIINQGVNLPQGVFSPDGKYFLAYGQGQKMSSSGEGLELEYQIYDVFAGSVLTEPTIMPERRIPLVWY